MHGIRMVLPPPPPERWHDGDKGGRRVKATMTKRAMAMVTRVASNNESDGNGNEGGKQATTTRAMAAATIVVGKGEGVAGDKKSEGGMTMATMKRMAGEQWQWQWQQRRQWQMQCG